MRLGLLGLGRIGAFQHDAYQLAYRRLAGGERPGASTGRGGRGETRHAGGRHPGGAASVRVMGWSLPHLPTSTPSSSSCASPRACPPSARSRWRATALDSPRLGNSSGDTTSSRSNEPTHSSTRTPWRTRRLRSVASMRNPAFSATRREAMLPASQRHSMSSMPAVVTAHWQTARTAVVATPRLRARGSTQYPTSAAPGSPRRRPTRPSRVAVAASSATNSARRPSSQPAIYACSTWDAASSSR